MLLRTFVLLVGLSGPLGAVVIGYDATNSGTFGDPNSSTYVVTSSTVADGVNLSGVVEISSGVGTCSGALLSDHVSILTAAHCLFPQGGSGMLPSSVQVYFNYPGCGGGFPYCGGTYNVTDPANMFLDPTWISSGENLGDGNDLAVIRLSSPAPAFAAVYSLFGGNSIDLSTPIEVAGAGESGKGQIDGAAYPAGNSGDPIRQGESNYIGTCASGPVTIIGCASGYALIAQFYAGSPLNNQVAIAPGDSGGPSFYNGELIGVHQFYACDTSNCSITDANSYWGDTYAGGLNATWIESVEANSIPEPGSMLLMAVGLGAIVLRRQRIGANRPR